MSQSWEEYMEDRAIDALGPEPSDEDYDREIAADRARISRERRVSCMSPWEYFHRNEVPSHKRQDELTQALATALVGFSPSPLLFRRQK